MFIIYNSSVIPDHSSKNIVNMVKYGNNKKRDNTMPRRTYTPEYKAKLVIEVLQGEKD